MVCCKIYLTLSALITCHVSANYEYERSKRLNPEDTSHWNKQYEVYESAPSEILPHHFYGLSENRPVDRFGSPSEPSPINIKKEPIEEKNWKKIPFYAFSNNDSTRYKELTPDLGVAHCQEIKVKSAGKKDGSRKGVTTCYNCKDPKTKSTYERCLYSSHPEESTSANSKVERYLSAPAGFRFRRSNFERNKHDYGKRNPYRFTDEYFTDATRDVPAAYENKGEKCDKIVKDSMVCMVCKDAKTNGKYEQCSYVKQPHEKAYSYVKSSSFGKPREDDSDERSESSRSEVSNVEASNEQKDRSPSTAEPREYSYPSADYSEKTLSVDKQEEVQDAPSADCKQIEKDSKTCTVCKDPKIGGTFEKCTYNYQPSDKLYKYSRSKTFGYPDKTSGSVRDLNNTQTEKSKNFDYPQSSDSTYDYLDKSEPSTYPRRSDRVSEETQQVPKDSDGIPHGSPDYSSDYSNPGESSDYEFPSRNSDHDSYESQKAPSSKPVSEYQSEDISADNCKTVQKDSMTCKVCKDPETGNDFEQCSYSYQPSDKLYSYSKSSRFGNPENDKSKQTSGEDESSADSSETAKKSYDEYVPGQTYEASTKDEAKSDDDAESKKGVEAGYLDTMKKKAEIEEFMQNFRKEDRSKCKKIMRDKMTCYQCIDDKGFQKEECAFVAGHEPDKEQLVFHETKEFQVDAAPRDTRDFKPSSTRRAKVTESLEPNASASRNSYVRLEKPDNDYPDEASHTAEETKEAEPYDYTSETRAKYDKVLRLTLPAYMFSTSEHEAAFDEIVASSHNRR